MEIIELLNFTENEFTDLKILMTELSERMDLTREDLTQVIDNKNSHLYVLLEKDRIIGCATLCIFHSPTGRKASIEDVVVSSTYRGQHLGKKIMEHILKEAQKYAPINLQLTSKPKRIAANALYQSLGFQRKETNCYVMNINYKP